jgi:hypothetical protein
MGLCLSAALRAQETGVDRRPDSAVRIDISRDYRRDVLSLKWNELIQANILNSVRYENYYRAVDYAIDDDQSYTFFSSREVYPGLMTAREAGGGLFVPLNDRLRISAGVYALRYDFNFSGRPYYDGVIHVSADYDVTSWLTVGAHGQHAAFASENARRGAILPSPFVPVSGFGVHGTAMFNESFGIHGAIGREFDPQGHRWRPVYGIAPVINLNSLFK